jgi:toxin ParE1/3/4
LPRLQIGPRALDDLDEIRAWIGSENPIAAEAVVDRLVDRLQILEEHPHAGTVAAGLPRGVRRLVEPPYIIFYRFENAAVQVVRVLHGARRITRATLRTP